MLDGRLRGLIDPPLDRIAIGLAATGIDADQVTVAAALLGVAGAGLVAIGYPLCGLSAFLAGRLLDGLDGAVARRTKPTERGAFLDIALDFVVYAAFPLAFAAVDPAANALAACALLAGFLVNGTSFLAFAAVASRLGLETRAQGRKSIYYLGGLAEGGETILFFAAFCLLPGSFAPLALVFAALCLVSGLGRIAGAALMLKPPPPTPGRDRR